ncbi:MAG: hypothetical protein VW491_11265 [Gammaproteobacteria bacterium]
MEDGVKRDAGLVARLVGSAVALGAGLVSFGGMMVVFSWAFLFIMGGGVALLVARVVFFWLAPFMLEHAPVIVFYINNFVLIALDVIIDACIVAINTIRAAEFWNSDKPLAFTDIKSISVAEFETLMRDAIQTCSKVDSLSSMWTFGVTPSLSEAACPYVRAVLPSFRAIGTDLSALDGWVTYDPSPMGNNCAPSGEFADSTTPVGLCIGLASGYVVLEVVLPLLVVGLFMMACFSAIRHIVFDVIKLVVVVAYQLVELAVNAADVVHHVLATLVHAV